MFSRSARIYDAIYASVRDYRREAAELDRLIQERKPGARTLLDVACGTGAHLEHLSGYEIEGLDLDPEMLAVARERLPNVPFHEADMADFDLGKHFEAVVCMFSGIGYVRTEERLRSTIASMTRHLEGCGVLVVEPWLAPGDWLDRHVGAVFVDEPELKIARMTSPDARAMSRSSSSSTSSARLTESSGSPSAMTSASSQSSNTSRRFGPPRSRPITTSRGRW